LVPRREKGGRSELMRIKPHKGNLKRKKPIKGES
jgi:hypothetical protein